VELAYDSRGLPGVTNVRPRDEATWSRWCQMTPTIFSKSFISHCLITIFSANDQLNIGDDTKALRAGFATSQTQSGSGVTLLSKQIKGGGDVRIAIVMGLND
jgi:hypothetical protein